MGTNRMATRWCHLGDKCVYALILYYKTFVPRQPMNDIINSTLVVAMATVSG